MAETQPKPRKKSKARGSHAGAASEDSKLPPMRIQPGESLTHFNKLSVCGVHPILCFLTKIQTCRGQYASAR